MYTSSSILNIYAYLWGSAERDSSIVAGSLMSTIITINTNIRVVIEQA